MGGIITITILLITYSRFLRFSKNKTHNISAYSQTYQHLVTIEMAWDDGRLLQREVLNSINK